MTEASRNYDMDQSSRIFESSYQTSCLNFNLASLSLGSVFGGDPKLFKNISTPSFQRVPGAPTDLSEADKMAIDKQPTMKSLFAQRLGAHGEVRKQITTQIWNMRELLTEQILERRRAEFFALIDSKAA